MPRASHERATALPGGYGGRLEPRPACHAGLLCLTPTQTERATDKLYDNEEQRRREGTDDL